MTGRFEHVVELDSPVDRVARVLLDPTLYCARYAAAGATDCEIVSRDEATDGSLVLVSRRAESGSLPGPVARLVRGAARITQTEHWSAPGPDGGRQAGWTVVTAGVPVDISGTTELRPTATGSRLVETGVITAQVPMLSRVIERVAVEQSAGKLRREWDWLAEQLGRG